ncbi:MAG: lamin tail domain-containing protein [Verrucomicrobiaceae bacterium]
MFGKRVDQFVGKLRATVVLGLGLGVSMGWGQVVRISEAMSSNGSVVADADGDFSDWVELHNTGDVPVSLDGWFLTDKEGDRTQWRLPNVSLTGKGFLVVFASGKDRAVAGAELHSNFKLSASGEYLALVRPDGVTVEDEVVLPDLAEDASYGFGFPSVGTEVIFDQGAACRALIPVPSTDVVAWRSPEFDDSGWLSGVTGVGYEGAPGGTNDYTSLVGLDVSAMRNVNASVFVRVPFGVADLSRVNGLTLRMKYEDGFVAFLNGEEGVRSSQAPEVLEYDSKSTTSNSDLKAVVFEDFDLTARLADLKEVGNVLGIHGMNSAATSNDVIFMPRLEAHLAGDLDPASVGQLLVPTPGGANTGVLFSGFLETPTVHPARGFYDSAIEVAISSGDEGAEIRYTTDGSEPGEGSPLAPATLSISETTNLRVKAFQEGKRVSATRTDTYLFVDDLVTVPEALTTINGQKMVTGIDAAVLAETYLDAAGNVVTVQDALKAIPALSITTDEANLFDPEVGIYVNATESWERPASAEWIHADGKKGFQIDAGLRIRGGYSRNPQFAKHSFRLFFRDEYGEGRLEYDFFGDGGVTSFKKMDLRTTQAGSWAAEADVRNTFLRDIVFRDSSAAMGDVATRSAWCHIYLNGEYWGMYMTEERVEENFGADYFGGDKDDYDLVKIWRPYDNQPVGSGFWIEDPAPTGNLDAYRRLHSAMLAGFESDAAYFSVQGMNANGERDPGHERLVDVENMINFLLGIYYAAAVDNGITWWTGQDNLLNNLYGIYNRENPDGFKWIHHDGEISYDRVAFKYPAKLDRTGPFTHPRLQEFRYFNPQTLHDKLVSNTEYRLKFADQVFKQLKGNGPLVREKMEARLDARAAQIDRAVVAESSRWGSTTLDRDAWAVAVEGQRDFSGRAGDRSDEVIAYLAADGLIPGVARPEFSHDEGVVMAGTAVTLSAGAGTIYYTTDGSDPRAIGGAVAGEIYGGGIAIDQPTRVKARAFDGAEWSALSEGTFVTPEVPLAFTEVMYHAAGGSEYDFIEIQNISAWPVDLSGYKIGNGVELSLSGTLAPGEFLVAVEDAGAFSSFYGGGIQVVGEYAGGLSNAGERVDLEFNGRVVVSFRYSDGRNWPQAADGAGHSLVPLSPAVYDQERGSLDYGGNWRSSTYRNGSPGQGDVSPGARVVLNEVVAHTSTGLAAPFDSNDQVELYNPAGSAVILNGWYLSDDAGNPMKWAIPDGTVVPGMGYVVFDEDDFHPDRTSGFGLDRAGEQLLLVSPGGVVDMVRFKGQALGASWGRYPDGSASWMATAPTVGAANEVAPAGVRISELMYHPLPPAGAELEYIQLKNESGGTVVLENGAGTYRIDGGVSYTFPAGVSLGAGERLWVVSFDPADAGRLGAFGAAYGLNVAEELFFGPYAGVLDNGGERVALEAPQAPGGAVEVSWVVVDELFYFNQEPWPAAAAGTGMPLVRTGPGSWGVITAGDSDADGIPDVWEQIHFGGLVLAGGDADGDGQNNLMEYVAGTDPNDGSSFLGLELENGVLTWEAKPGRVYTVYWTDDLALPFTPLSAGITTGEYTDEGHVGEARSFYRLGVEIGN